MDLFPFSSLDNNRIIKELGFNSNTSCFCSGKICRSRLKDLPSLELTSTLYNTPNLRGFDPENNILTEVNFDCYTSHKFHSSEEIRDISEGHYFSVFHSNVRILAANFDNFTALLTDLNHSFNVTEVSETKINNDKDCGTNISIPGYNLFSQPSLHNAGGIGFYIRCEIKFHFRDDLITTTNDFECLWIEVHNKSSNIVYAVVYRHLHSNLDNFTEYFYAAIDKISK